LRNSFFSNLGAAMASISYDGQSFLIDGRRTWLVSGAIHYSRVPRELWRDRIHAARQAGLNCIETYVFWNFHESRPGVFDFTGDRDLRHFIQLIGQAGMYCILRPGPFVCAEWDNGGLPAWLAKIDGIKLREGHPAFLEACSRYLGAVMEQVRDLQVTAPGAGRAAGSDAAATGPDQPAMGFTPGQGAGPIILMQAENEWFASNKAQHDAYLHELVRYLRENGCTTPIVNCNNLWQRIDGTIDAWNGIRHMAADLRQLRVVQPHAPRLVTEFWPGWFDPWDGPHATHNSPELVLYRLAGLLAVGAQYNLYMFHGGTNFAFTGGRSIVSKSCFMTTSYDYDAPLAQGGKRTRKYDLIKRVSTFASHFGHILAALDPEHQNAVAALTETDHGPSVIHQRGEQGDVVFLLKALDDTREKIEVMLPNGLTLPVPLGPDEPAAWLLLDATLAPGIVLDYTNLRPFALPARKMLVLYGPAGADGIICINDAPFHMTVPTGKAPLVESHEDLTIVVLNHEQVDAAYLTPRGLVVGADGLILHGTPRPRTGWSTATTIALDGKTATKRVTASPRPTAPRLASWSQHEPTDLLDGSSAAYQPIAGPTTHEKLNNAFGYGWYRITGPAKTARANQALAPGSADRLHLFIDGKPSSAILGVGPAAQYDPSALSLGKCNVILADNLGRMNFGLHVGQTKGLWSHLYAVKPVKLPKPKIVRGTSPDPFTWRGYVLNHRVGERHPADALTWKIKPAARMPMILDIQGLPLGALIQINGVPIAFYNPEGSAGYLRLLLEIGSPHSPLTGGQNDLTLALVDSYDPKACKLDAHVKLYQTTANLTEKAEWAFAPWPASPPSPEAFAAAAKGGARPCWYRTIFNVKDATTPLWLEPLGLSKGQLYLNGHNVGRYFVATAAGKKVPPQTRYYLPEPWLRTDAPNELVVFDEHGKAPNKCKLVYDANGPYL
jgi:hypothetical protein